MRGVAPLIFTLILIAACGGGGGAASDDPTATISGGDSTGMADGDSTEVEETWPEKWCREVRLGMTLDELVAIMGEPEEITGLGTASWFMRHWMLSAFFGTGERAQSLIAYETTDDPEPFPCSTERNL
jgi:hypothetical protein